MSRKTTGRKQRLSPIFSWALRIAFAIIMLWPVTLLLYRFVDPPITMLMIERRFFTETKSNKKIQLHHRSFDLDDYSKWLPLAVIAAEDQRFMEHHGFDVPAIRKALKHNKRNPKRQRGASTLSQQTVKNAFLWEDRSWIRKLLEVPLTVAVETFWGKKRILEVYMEICELGPGVFGFEAASRHWFGKSSAKLTRHEAALLAACLPSPRTSNPRNPSATLASRAAWIEEQYSKIDSQNILDQLGLKSH